MTAKPTIKGIHHVALICSDYAKSKAFYTGVLGFVILDENYREERRSHKLDLALPDGSRLELFSFPDAPPRPSRPEAQGLRHLAFAVENVGAAKTYLESHSLEVEPIRVDPHTGEKFTFFKDPDGWMIELGPVR